MTLNPDCIRDLMIILVKITGFSKTEPYIFKEITCESLMTRPDLSTKYTKDEVAYTLIQLAESDYIRMNFEIKYDVHASLGCILYVTPKGHEFTAKIENDQRWGNKIKPAISAFGSISLSVIEAIASGATSAYIDKLF